LFFSAAQSSIGRRQQNNVARIFVSNLPVDCEWIDVRRWLETMGYSTGFIVVQPTTSTNNPGSFAIVALPEVKDAVEAARHLNGQMFSGNILFVSKARNKRKKDRRVF